MRFKDKIYGLNILITHELQIGLQLKKTFDKNANN
jgi:hypothetical protein